MRYPRTQTKSNHARLAQPREELTNKIGNATADQEMVGQASSLSRARARSPRHQRLYSRTCLSKIIRALELFAFMPIPIN
jgi:hypothetical protein